MTGEVGPKSSHRDSSIAGRLPPAITAHQSPALFYARLLPYPTKPSSSIEALIFFRMFYGVLRDLIAPLRGSPCQRKVYILDIQAMEE